MVTLTIDHRIVAYAIAANSGAGATVAERDEKFVVSGPRLVVLRRSVELALGNRMPDADWQAIIQQAQQAGHECAFDNAQLIVP
jgi:hypothetical protein